MWCSSALISWTSCTLSKEWDGQVKSWHTYTGQWQRSDNLVTRSRISLRISPVEMCPISFSPMWISITDRQQAATACRQSWTLDIHLPLGLWRERGLIECGLNMRPAWQVKLISCLPVPNWLCETDEHRLTGDGCMSGPTGPRWPDHLQIYIVIWKQQQISGSKNIHKVIILSNPLIRCILSGKNKAELNPLRWCQYW